MAREAINPKYGVGHSYSSPPEPYVHGDHYASLSSNYDTLYSDYNAAMVNIINRQLKFSPDDCILDVGGGTAEVSHRLWMAHSLRSPVVCIDPSAEMLAIARQKKGVETVQTTAEEYCSSTRGKVFSKILMIGSYHHFKDPSMIFDGVSRLLSDNGVCVVSMNSKSATSTRLFSKATELIKECNFSEIARLAESKGLRARVTSDCDASKIAKDTCFDFMRQRGFTWLRQLSDNEIEEGIREMDSEYKKVLEINVEYKVNMCIITKH